MIFDSAALAAFRQTQESTMMHECTVEAYTVGGDGTISYGEPVTTICGFKAENSRLRGNGALYDAIEADAELRLPLSVTINTRDRVTLTKSFGTELDPVRHFEVCNLPDSYGPSGHVAKLREVYA